MTIVPLDSARMDATSADDRPGQSFRPRFVSVGGPRHGVAETTCANHKVSLEPLAAKSTGANQTACSERVYRWRY